MHAQGLSDGAQLIASEVRQFENESTSTTSRYRKFMIDFVDFFSKRAQGGDETDPVFPATPNAVHTYCHVHLRNTVRKGGVLKVLQGPGEQTLNQCLSALRKLQVLRPERCYICFLLL
jgi:hypothetical protein